MDGRARQDLTRAKVYASLGLRKRPWGRSVETPAEGQAFPVRLTPYPGTLAQKAGLPEWVRPSDPRDACQANRRTFLHVLSQLTPRLNVRVKRPGPAARDSTRRSCGGKGAVRRRDGKLLERRWFRSLSVS